MASKTPHSKLVILDRDGVINEDSDLYIKSPDEWIPIPGSLEAIAKLNQAGYHIAIATNQSGVGRGLYDMDMLNAIHDKLHRLLAKVGGHVDAIFFCPHAASDDCDCRQPKPGMLQAIGKRFDLSLKYVAVVGDTLPVLQAAFAVGSVPYLLLSKTGLSTKEKGGLPPSTIEMQDLRAVVDSLNQREQLAVEMVEAARHALHKKK